MTLPLPRLVSAVLVALALVPLAIANAAGYRYGVADQSFYFPSVLRAVDPTLYPRDSTLLQAQGRLMVSDEITAWMVSRLGVPLEPLVLTAHVLGLVLLLASVWVLARHLSTSPWTAAACCVALTLRHRITETGANTFEGYYHPRGLAFGCGAAAAAALASSRPGFGWTLVLAALVLHPTTGAWWALWMLGATFVARRSWRRPLIAGTAVTMVLGSLLLVATPLAARLVVMDAAWIAPFASKDYVFPTAWGIGPWLANLVLPLVVTGVWRWRLRQQVAAPWEAGAVAGVLLLTAVFLASLPLIAARLALAVQLQTSRIFWIVDLFAVIGMVWWLAEAGPARRLAGRRPMAVALLLLAVSAGRGVYITQVEHPERRFVQRGLEDSDWVRVGHWLATRTPPDTHVLADPDHDWKFGHSVRLTARRDVLVEGVKDAALSLYDRNVALQVQARLQAIGDFSTLDASRARQLAQRYDLDVLVIDRDLPLPEMHRDGRFRVYRLR